jgi:hypothetical protein
VEAADQVLAVARIDPGLAADRAVDLREQRGRDLDVVEAAQQDRGGEAGEVADDPAAERDQRRPALDHLRQDLVEQPLEASHALGRLAGRQHDPAGHDGGRLEARFQRGEVTGLRQMVIGHDHHGMLAQQGPQQAAGARQQTGTDHDLVAAVAELDREAAGAGHGGLAARAAAGSAARMRPTTALIGPLLLSITRSASP